ncbi:hypothetical protein Psch_00546 [Pelotomaculum schinkii]|uniref:Uncharacterized protein n=1 Tax=Pelotomaculum schinkii TaxID=78350 RepID=A0A4Y7RFB5_9FIRM|nr:MULTISPECIES: hypothetical protein [Pelotomaculum]TEB07007.1 hypothetical protein Psch_00546 [Pelotomaculum schinkii]TEB16836.1 hypothetical protein Psfp_01002 [Pelotomaculum sp. FP]
MKLYWLCEYAQKGEFKVAKDTDDLFQKKSEEINKEFSWVKDNFECTEICEVDGYKIVLEKINKSTDGLEGKVWIEEIQETFK